MTQPPDQRTDARSQTVPTDEQARVEAAAARTGAGIAALRDHPALAPVLRNLGLLVVLALLCVVGTSTSPNFLTVDNFRNILVSSSVIGVVTVGMTFVIIGGGIDLSVGALVALSSVWASTVASQSHGAAVMILCAVLVGTGAGIVNGVLIAYGRLVPFIATLAMMVSARGLAAKMADNKTQIVTVQQINDIALKEYAGIPLLAIIFGAVVLAGWLVLNRTTFGRRTFALGGSSEATRLAGININVHTVLLYALSGACCGIAAVMLLARTTTGSSTHGELYELDAIAAVIIGGTLLTGGRGTLVGSILGVFVFTTITNIFILNNLATSVQNITKGVIIVAAVLVQTRATSRHVST
ncbi:MAG: ABC transporter permease [Nocardioides sp.]|nr:ABC transporter permease [Nocardioides sp.]